MYTYLLFCNAAQVAREHERIHQHPPLKKFQLFRPVNEKRNTMNFVCFGGRGEEGDGGLKPETEATIAYSLNLGTII